MTSVCARARSYRLGDRGLVRLRPLPSSAHRRRRRRRFALTNEEGKEGRRTEWLKGGREGSTRKEETFLGLRNEHPARGREGPYRAANALPCPLPKLRHASLIAAIAFKSASTWPTLTLSLPSSQVTVLRWFVNGYFVPEGRGIGATGSGGGREGGRKRRDTSEKAGERAKA